MKHVVILGAGFGGLNVARALAKVPVRVTLLDRRNHHLFQALLYQVASAALNAADIAYPIRRVFRHQRNVTVLLGDAERIDVAGRTVHLLDGAVPYDFLVVATGATHSYFGRDEWARHAPGLKSIEDALEIRRRVLLAYEAAERTVDPVQRRAWLTFVVVGGGPTGVELAGALGEISRHSLERDFRNVDPKQARVLLLEGADRILGGFPADLSQKAVEQLQRLGVEVHTGARVTGIDEGGVTVGRERIETRTVAWAAGVQASPLARTLGAPLDRAGRVKVMPDLTLPGHPEVFVIGDLAAFEQDGRNQSGVAPFAIQGGLHTAKNIARALREEPLEPFRYDDQGSLATIGRAAAVAVLGGVKLSGFTAWLAWLVIHLYKLIGFRNRLFVIAHWAWAYVTFERGARLITGGPVGPIALASPGAQPAPTAAPLPPSLSAAPSHPAVVAPIPPAPSPAPQATPAPSSQPS